MTTEYANTMQQFNQARLLPIWQRNAEANLKLLGKRGKRLRGIRESRRYKHIRNKPAFIIGAGPSLDLNKKELAKIGKNGIIISTDLAVRPLLKEGIVPDFSMTVDVGEVASLYSYGFKELSQIKLLAATIVNPTVIKLWDGEVFFFNIEDNHIPWTIETLPKMTGNIGVIPSGTNVGAMATMVACYLKLRPIYLVGMDLGFPRMRAWAENTYHDECWMKLARGEKAAWGGPPLDFQKLKTRNRIHGAYIRSFSDLVEVEDVHQLKIVSRQLYINFYRWWFEWAVYTWGLDKWVFNATEGGTLTSFKQITLKHAVESL